MGVQWRGSVKGYSEINTENERGYVIRAELRWEDRRRV